MTDQIRDQFPATAPRAEWEQLNRMIRTMSDEARAFTWPREILDDVATSDDTRILLRQLRETYQSTIATYLSAYRIRRDRGQWNVAMEIAHHMLEARTRFVEAVQALRLHSAESFASRFAGGIVDDLARAREYTEERTREAATGLGSALSGLGGLALVGAGVWYLSQKKGR